MGITQSIFTGLRSKEEDEQQQQLQPYPFVDNNNDYKKPYNGASFGSSSSRPNTIYTSALDLQLQSDHYSSSKDEVQPTTTTWLQKPPVSSAMETEPRKTEPMLPVVNPTNNPPFLQIQDSSSSSSDSSSSLNYIYATVPGLNLQLQSDHYSSSEDEVHASSNSTTLLQKLPVSSAMETESNESSSSSDSSSNPNTIYTLGPDLNLQLQSDHYSSSDDEVRAGATTTSWLQKQPVSSAMETESNEDEGSCHIKEMDVIINMLSLDYQSLARTNTFDVVDSAFFSIEKEEKEDEEVEEVKQKNKKIKKINNKKKVEEEKQNKKKINNKKKVEKEKQKIKNKKRVEEAKVINCCDKEKVEEEKKIICVVDEGKWIKHYHSSHKILLVGEGDFSFSASLALAFGSASNMIATSLDSRKFLKKNYGNAVANINNQTSRGCKVVHGIDATQIAAYPWLGKMKFDRIIYNFPFAGFFKDLSRDEVLKKHRRLVSLFLKNAKQMIGKNGEIHITLKTNSHKEWNLENIASSHGLRLIEAPEFNLLDYPGYNTKRGFGGDDNFDCNPAKTYKFGPNKQMDVIINVPSLDYQSLARTNTFDVVDSAFISFEKEVKEDEQGEEEKQKMKLKNKKKVEEEKVIKCCVRVEAKWITHYNSSHKILLVGEGDFSFSATLALAFGSASNIIATSLDLRKFLKKSYGNAMVNINNLTSRGCKVVHGVDATQIASNLCLGKKKFDRIIYNFPFAGFFKDLSRDEVLKKHRRLVSLFLKNAKQVIAENGEIHITHKTNGFHKEWDLENIASSHGLRLIEATKFNQLDYPGYNTKRGFGGDDKFDCNPAKTYKFGLKKIKLILILGGFSECFAVTLWSFCTQF